MDAVDLRTVADAVGGELRGSAEGIRGVAIDSRHCGPEDVFVALRGERVDGHAYVADLAGRAAGAIVESWVDAPIPQCRVFSGRGALTALGRWNRERCPAAVAGITGSNGKTTVKELLAAILGGVGPTLATAGNHNNELGVPLTLCRLETRHAYAVIEMGASGPGDIAHLARSARPRVGLITNAAAAHLKGFGSLAGVATAKGELYTALPADGIAVLNAADPQAARWREMIGDRRCITFGVDEEQADVVARADGEQLALEIGGRRVRAPFALLGRHNRLNAAAAAATALALSVPTHAIASGIGRVTPVPGRLAPTSARRGARLIDDSYNANPDSLTAALDVLAEHDGERWLVLGDMAELGDEETSLHRRAGEYARRCGIERLFTIGPLAGEAAAAFGEGAERFADRGALVERLGALLGPGTTVLVKGSRAAALDQVVAGLVDDEGESWGGGD